ncbi:MAG: CHAT domain-containing protein [Planctomycetota bacterium]|nr:CHAT domain-containing protein [Planctomycetota bacterium]
MRGVLTAEELSTLDLSGCELAVLSACDTSVGVARPDHGVASLQQALHLVGARSTLTSLWKADDEATQRLIQAFYAKLWGEGLGKAEALRQAKRQMRAENYPAMYWAGWVLTGDPN